HQHVAVALGAAYLAVKLWGMTLKTPESPTPLSPGTEDTWGVGRCPNCVFIYAWDGVECRHCHCSLPTRYPKGNDPIKEPVGFFRFRSGGEARNLIELVELCDR